MAGHVSYHARSTARGRGRGCGCPCVSAAPSSASQQPPPGSAAIVGHCRGGLRAPRRRSGVGVSTHARRHARRLVQLAEQHQSDGLVHAPRNERGAPAAAASSARRSPPASSPSGVGAWMRAWGRCLRRRPPRPLPPSPLHAATTAACAWCPTRHRGPWRDACHTAHQPGGMNTVSRVPMGCWRPEVPAWPAAMPVGGRGDAGDARALTGHIEPASRAAASSGCCTCCMRAAGAHRTGEAPGRPVHFKAHAPLDRGVIPPRLSRWR
jgi:hypothetical protein